ncbi:MAG: hypothetical protein L6V87_06775 [Ruminococcus sp.]|nr:MAG: hypothetical protein L6V87_06775 [Ruminococcus sp.]
MDSADKNSLFGQYKKRFKFKQRLWNILSIVYTLILIPLLRFLDGRDYSVVWRIISVVTTVALITMNFIQSRSMKRQLEAISEASAEKIAAELERCEWYRVFALTSEYLFSKEGLILPYYEIMEIITNTYVGSPSATNMTFRTRSFGRIYVPVGLGNMDESFYKLLSEKCPNAELKFRVNYQKADMEEYYNTLKGRKHYRYQKKMRRKYINGSFNEMALRLC